MQRRSSPYQTVITTALAHADDGIPYERLVNVVAATIEHSRARIARMNRLKRNPSETPAETILKGQAIIARRYIDAAHRLGRITYFDSPRERRVFPGDPASTGGRHAKPRTWQEEQDSLAHPANAQPQQD